MHTTRFPCNWVPPDKARNALNGWGMSKRLKCVSLKCVMGWCMLFDSSYEAKQQGTGLGGINTAALFFEADESIGHRPIFEFFLNRHMVSTEVKKIRFLGW